MTVKFKLKAYIGREENEQGLPNLSAGFKSTLTGKFKLKAYIVREENKQGYANPTFVIF